MNVKTIASSILKSAYTQFTSVVSNVTYKNISTWGTVDRLTDKEAMDPSGKMTVQWSADIEMREWGIKSVVILVMNVTGRVAIEYVDATDTDYYNFDAKSEGFKITSNIEFVSDTLTPKEVTIDFKAKTVIVE